MEPWRGVVEMCHVMKTLNKDLFNLIIYKTQIQYEFM